ncbi:MAG: hypothetical protein KA297_18000, partial [Kofleriaceae bacterium]|nr:hypothetical protein [Kofleriaceae bacterium]
LRGWDRQEAGNALALIRWMLNHPRARPGNFATARRRGASFADALEAHVEGFTALAAWVRAYHDDVEALVQGDDAVPWPAGLR